MTRRTIVTSLAALALACSSSDGSGANAGSGGSAATAGGKCAGACGRSQTGGNAGVGGARNGEWPKADCIPGMDQTCNAEPTMSAIAGFCGMAGTCLCKQGFAVELPSGKCAVLMAEPGSPCEQGGGGGCNDDPFSSMRAGLCLTDGSCYCLGEAAKNPKTGLCKMP